MPFEITSTHFLLVMVLLLSGLGGLAMLRILAIFRYAQIVPYERAREARRLRADYEAQLAGKHPLAQASQEDDQEVITV